MDELLFYIIKLLIVIVITVVMRYGIPLAKQLIENSKLSQLEKWVKIGVDAAQQTVKGSGADKKAIVTDLMRGILQAKNISISDEQLDSLIEAAVFAMKNGNAKEAE